MVITVKKIKDDTLLSYIGVLYSLDESNNEDEDVVEIVPHGNLSKATDHRPYIRTAQKTLERQRELLDAGKSVQAVYKAVLEEARGPLRSTSQSHEPRDTRQIYTINAKRRRQEEKERQSVESNDDLTNIIRRIASLQVVQSVVINQGSYFYFISTDRQLNDIEMFCCSQNEVSVLGIDTTFNLSEMWITDSSYQNKRVVGNVSGDHPVFLGPDLFHFTKDEKTFTLLYLYSGPRFFGYKKP